ncbi:TetR/AcrR family transcriptional regulator [Leekyejoonella antrihumi]|uniref:TetR/AcrR family transcriptional regulator n=1 Tax=Leekyejoonella antrihumi TaxID=1660198 RepID=A0A563E6Q4_9MICO|nr:TetR/AcrR family transcriptional regulator [Leekyejoonella antrihumi]TWP37979.1 TetR/AcrR family transcriptional regulator [Leekyejoonella antrihumi]
MPTSRAAPRRARPLPVQERREALIDATMHALRQERRPLSTREIAQAAGVAEGTIFRIFASKDELIDAVIAKAFSTRTSDLEMDGIRLDQPLRDRLVDFVRIVQIRLQNVFGLMQALGLTAPPVVKDHPDAEGDRTQPVLDAMDRIVGGDHDQLRVSARELLRYLRLLTFSGSHEGVCAGQVMTPEEIVDVVLTGVRRAPWADENHVDGDLSQERNVMRLPK